MSPTEKHSIIEINNVTKDFGSVRALNGVSMQIKQGEFFSLLGPSGCGKTTLLRMISGFETPTSGSISIAGESMTYLKYSSKLTPGISLQSSPMDYRPCLDLLELTVPI